MQQHLEELTWERPLKLGMSGQQAVRVQEWLNLQGHPGPILPKYDRSVAERVSRFVGQPLENVTTLEEMGFRQLAAPLFRAVEKPFIAPERQPLSRAMLMVAKQHLAQSPREVGGPNLGPWVRYYMRGRQGAGWPWCAGAVSRIRQQAASLCGLAEPDYHASCYGLMVEHRKTSAWVADKDASGVTAWAKLSRDPAAVAIFLLRKSGQSVWHHTGIAFDFTPHEFSTIEGNTNLQGSREGTHMLARKRTYQNMDFILVAR